MKRIILLTTITLFLGCSLSVFGEGLTEKERVLMVVDQFLQVLESGDTALAKEILVENGSNFSMREEGDGFKIRYTPYDSLIKSLPKTKGKYKEVLKKPKVMLYKSMAVVWAPYRFYIDGEFSHCGMDSFSLIKDGEKWKIVSIIYTVEKRTCK